MTYLISKTAETPLCVRFTTYRGDFAELSATIKIAGASLALSPLSALEVVKFPAVGADASDATANGVLTVYDANKAVVSRQRLDVSLVDGEVVGNRPQEVYCAIPVVITVPQKSVDALANGTTAFTSILIQGEDGKSRYKVEAVEDGGVATLAVTKVDEGA